ncbi:MAG: hypothetical protein Q9208_005756 [Pyrenodesmia sp. 3 TL-2023]
MAQCTISEGNSGGYWKETAFSEMACLITRWLRYNESRQLVRTTRPGLPDYVGTRIPELDAAWEDLLGAVDVFVTAEEEPGLGGNLYLEPDSRLYMAEPTVFHNLHCMNTFRPSLPFNWVYFHYKEETVLRPHLDHFIDNLRESLMCTGDKTFYQLYGFETLPIRIDGRPMRSGFVDNNTDNNGNAFRCLLFQKMQPPFPSLTAEWHNDTYHAISPTNPTVSAKGKTVVVTGGGAGIGREIAKAYAEAGAAHVALLDRNGKTLDEAKCIINEQSPDTKVTTHVLDVTDEEAVGKAAKDLNGWDILILNAGIVTHPAPINETKLADWWRVYEVNVKGAVTCTQAFLPTRNPSSSASTSFIGINACIVQLPAGVGPTTGNSAYTSSKIAQLKVMEFLAAENPQVFVASVHPGIVVTPMTLEHWDGKGGMKEDRGLHLDDEARFLRGRFVWANWDMEQLKARAKEIGESPQMLTSNVLGWPYQPKE